MGRVIPHLEALVREPHRDAWIVVDRDERMATTRMGSIPGHTSADLAINFVMLDAPRKVEAARRGTHRVCGVVPKGRTFRRSVRPASAIGGLANCVHG